MVGIVIVSHSKAIAKSVQEFAEYMAPKAKLSVAGGSDTDSFGVSKRKIKRAITKLANKDGVIVVVDIGSATLLTKEVIAETDFRCRVEMVDCPLMEGVMVASLDAQMKKDIDSILSEVNEISKIPKWQ